MKVLMADGGIARDTVIALAEAGVSSEIYEALPRTLAARLRGRSGTVRFSLTTATGGSGVPRR